MGVPTTDKRGISYNEATTKQKGPKGPGLLTWGKGQMSQWIHLQRTTNGVHLILVEDL